MNYFPSWLRPSSGHLFPERKREHVKALLCEDIKIHLISRENEEEYFDLDRFRRLSLTFNISASEVLNVVEELKKDLEDMGWNVRYCFGNTVLFIYSTEEPPKNCW